jgi:C1A family cysteine protease
LVWDGIAFRPTKSRSHSGGVRPKITQLDLNDAVLFVGFQSVQETGEILMLLPGATPDGGHAIVLVGYELAPRVAGGGAFIFRNSWGKDWARLRGRHGGSYGALFLITLETTRSRDSAEQR